MQRSHSIGKEIIDIFKDAVSSPKISTFIEAVSGPIALFFETQQIDQISKIDNISDYYNDAAQIFGDYFDQVSTLTDSYLTSLGPDWGAGQRLSLSTDGGAFFGDEYDEEITGSSGQDYIYAGAGNDLVYGLGGVDDLRGEAGADTLFGGSENDSLFGGTGDDTLYGGADNDTLKGEDNDDTLYGEEGRDTLYGDGGNDTLHGGEGADTQYGGAGSDTFVYDMGEIPTLASPYYLDEIRDFNQGNTGSYDVAEGDSIDISAIVGAAYAGGTGEAFADLVRLTISPVDHRTRP